MKRYMEILGHKVRDRVTGFTGVASSVHFDLYGCVQCIVSPAMDPKTGKIEESRYFDHKRLEVLTKKPVMDVPAFSDGAVEIGPTEKPLLDNRVR